MKKLIFICLLGCINLSLKAQKNDKALIRIKYSFTHLQDTNQRENPHREEMMLIAGKNSSIYTSYDKSLRNKAMRESVKEQIQNQAGGKLSINLSSFGARTVTNSDYYYFPSQKKYFLKERLVNNYLMEYPIDKIDWKILKDTMSFSGIQCQKATARFKGRNWVAWFAPDLAFQSGPWKLNDLPGLIIEAYDDKKEVHFQFNGIEKIEVQTDKQDEEIPTNGVTIRTNGLDKDPKTLTEIKLPEDAIKTTKKDYDRLKEVFDKDPQGFVQTQMPGPGASSTNIQSSRIISSSTNRKKTIINNPIELSEN